MYNTTHGRQSGVGAQAGGLAAGSRVPEFLEGLKSEYDNMARECNVYKLQKEEVERKLQQQLVELTNMQQVLGELERNHLKIKQQYEEEIRRLKNENGAAAAANSTSSTSASTSSTAGAATHPNALPSTFSLTNPSTSTLAPVATTSAAAPPTQQPLGAGFSLSGLKKTADLKESDQLSLPVLSTQGTPSKPLMQLGEPKDMLTPPAVQQPIATTPISTQSSSATPSAPATTAPPSTAASSSTSATAAATASNDWVIGFNPSVQTSLNLDLAHTLPHGSVVCCVRFSADGKYLATGCNRRAQIFDAESGRKELILSLHEGGTAVVTPGDGSVPVPTLPKEDLYIRTVCFNPDGQILATGAEDKVVRLWSIPQRKVIQYWTGHELDVYSLEFNNDGRLLVSGSGDKKVKIWDVEKGRLMYTLGSEEVGPKDGVTSVAISPDGKYVAAGSLDRVVRVWDAATGYFLERFEGHTDSVYSVAFSPDGKTLASGSLDKTIKLWDLQVGVRQRSRCRATLSGHKDFVLSVAFSPDGNWIVSGSKDRTVQFWDYHTGSTHLMLQGHKNSVISVALSSQIGMFATGSGDTRARLWKYTTGNMSALASQPVVQQWQSTPTTVSQQPATVVAPAPSSTSSNSQVVPMEGTE